MKNKLWDTRPLDQFKTSIEHSTRYSQLSSNILLTELKEDFQNKQNWSTIIWLFKTPTDPSTNLTTRYSQLSSNIRQDIQMPKLSKKTYKEVQNGSHLSDY